MSNKLFSVYLTIVVSILLVLSSTVSLLPTTSINYHNNILLDTTRNCLSHQRLLMCVKERVLKLLQKAIIDDNVIEINDNINLIKDPNFVSNYTFIESNNLSVDLDEREKQLNDLLIKSVNEFFQSRNLRFNMPRSVTTFIDEGRKNKKLKKNGGMYLMMGMGMIAMMIKMVLAKIAFMAGTALITAKIALVISIIIALKKLLSSPAKSEVVVTSNADHGSSWHRSLVREEDSSDLPYRAYVPNNY